MNANVHDGICTMYGKWCYRNEREARAAARHVGKGERPGARGNLGAFRCPGCGHWHIGHQGGYLMRQKEKSNA